MAWGVSSKGGVLPGSQVLPPKGTQLGLRRSRDHVLHSWLLARRRAECPSHARGTGEVLGHWVAVPEEPLPPGKGALLPQGGQP